MIYCNTTCKYGTKFLAGVELIKEGRSRYNVPSENWPYPTEHKYGIQGSPYYAEVWVDGMDWQHSYWILESNNYDDPYAIPFIMFDDHSEQDKFNPYDFGSLIEAMLVYRMDSIWVKSGDLRHYTDLVWPFIKRIDKTEFRGHIDNPLYHFYMEHASQPRVCFWVNANFIPGRYI